MAFAEILNEEALELEAAGVDVVQFDEPAFNVFFDEVRDWGVKTLERAAAGGWQIVWSDEPAVKPGQKVSRKRVPAPLQVLGFTLGELKEARLASIVDFKGRKPGRSPTDQTGEL